MKYKVITIVALLVLISIFIPMNAQADYVENINMPSEVEQGEEFTVSFDASYFVSGSVYALIGLCDANNIPIKDGNGNTVLVTGYSKDYFTISETPLRRNIKCEVEDEPEGTYTLCIGIYDVDTGDSLTGVAKFTQSFEVIEGESPSSCSSIILIAGILGIVAGLAIMVKKKWR